MRIQLVVDGVVVYENSAQPSPPANPPPDPVPTPVPTPEAVPPTSGLFPPVSVLDFNQFGKGYSLSVGTIMRSIPIVNVPPNYGGMLMFQFGQLTQVRPTFEARIMSNGVQYAGAVIKDGQGYVRADSIIRGQAYSLVIMPRVPGTCSVQLNHAF